MEVVFKREKKEKKFKKIIRIAVGEIWEDLSLEEWEKGNGLRLWIIVKMYLYICQGVVSMVYLNICKLFNQCVGRVVSMVFLSVDIYILFNQCVRRVVSIICLDICMLLVCYDSYLYSLFRYLYVKLLICKENF